MSVSALAHPASASDYQNMFNNTNGLWWSGSGTVIPVQLPDGRKLWISGLGFSGLLTSSTTRPTGTVPNSFSCFIEEQTGVLNPYQPARIDQSNNRFFALPPECLSSNGPYDRWDPIAAVAAGNTLYVTAVPTSTDFTSFHPASRTGPIYLLQIRISTLSSGQTSIYRCTPLPVYTTTSFGTVLLDIGDGYLYVGGGQPYGDGSINETFLGRIAYNLIPDMAKQFQYFSTNNGGFWSSNASDMYYPILPQFGLFPYIWKEREMFYAISRLGNYGNDVVLYKSPVLSQTYANWTKVGTVYTVTPDSGATNFESYNAYVVPWAQLTSGKRLGYYTVQQSVTSWDLSHPNFSRPRFFEFTF